MFIDTVAMRVFVADRKESQLQGLARKLMVIAQRNRRLVPLQLMRHFCGVCVSLSLGFPMSRFYTHSLYFYMSLS